MPASVLVGAVAQRMGVVGVRADTPEPVQVEVAQPDDVGAELVQVGVHADGLGLLDDPEILAAGTNCAAPVIVSGSTPAARAAAS